MKLVGGGFSFREYLEMRDVLEKDWSIFEDLMDMSWIRFRVKYMGGYIINFILYKLGY